MKKLKMLLVTLVLPAWLLTPLALRAAEKPLTVGQPNSVFLLRWLATSGFAAAPRPNIVVIYTDDQGYGDMTGIST